MITILSAFKDKHKGCDCERNEYYFHYCNRIFVDVYIHDLVNHT